MRCNFGIRVIWQHFLSSITLLFQLAGCAGMSGAPPISSDTALTTSDPLHAAYLSKYYAAKDGMEEQRQIRNEFIEIRSALIDKNYKDFKKEIYFQRVGGNVSADIALLGLSGVGTAVSAATAKTWLSAISGGITGARVSVDKNVYFDQTLPALLAQMDGSRGVIRLRLLQAQALDVYSYPLMQAVADLEDYYAAGTIASAISGVTAQANIAKQDAATAIDNHVSKSAAEIKTILTEQGVTVIPTSTTEIGTALSACMTTKVEKSQATNRAALKAWLTKEQFKAPPTVMLIQFLKVPSNEAIRKKAYDDKDLLAQFKDCPLAAK
ncbi:hypothetical protein AAKU55_001145 [Oxalobacteraceae bacterium GrIS 1.11]